VRVKTSDQAGALGLFRSQMCYRKLAPVVDRLDAPLLESFTVVGMSEEELREHWSQGSQEFDVCFSTGDERVVWVNWMCEEELDS
jgi:hypothetical protein